MKEIILSVLGLFLMSHLVTAETPVTNVTPENSSDGEVKFTLEIAEPEGAGLMSVRLRVDLRSGKYEAIEAPGLYLRQGERMIGLVALYSSVDTEGSSVYWCHLDKEYLMDSAITLTARPVAPDEFLEVGVQSMEYVLGLKDFAGDPDSPNQAR